MADVKRLVEERHGAIDVLKTWVPRVALAIVFRGRWRTEVRRPLGVCAYLRRDRTRPVVSLSSRA